jgi:TRAP-type C4-dicarboxylate transport system permease small subunit
LDHANSEPVSGAHSRAPERLFTGLVGGLNAAGSLLVLAMVVMINIEAFSRTLLNAPFEGVIELIEIGIVAVVFLQLADATRKGVLTQSDGLLNWALARSPRLGHMLAGLIDIAAAAFMGLILYGSLPLLGEAWREGHYVGVQHVFTAPTWPIKLVIVVGCIVTMVQLAVLAASHFARARQAGHVASISGN